MKLRNKKTGEIMDLECITIFDRPDKYDTGDAIEEFYTLSELNEEWEDYTPTEPLIKDEKIRKAVRAWAEAFGYKHVTHRFYTDNGGKRFSLLERHAQDISLPEQGLEEAKDYTIAELCGEEEE